MAEACPATKVVLLVAVRPIWRGLTLYARKFARTARIAARYLDSAHDPPWNLDRPVVVLVEEGHRYRCLWLASVLGVLWARESKARRKLLAAAWRITLILCCLVLLLCCGTLLLRSTPLTLQSPAKAGFERGVPQPRLECSDARPCTCARGSRGAGLRSVDARQTRSSLLTDMIAPTWWREIFCRARCSQRRGVLEVVLAPPTWRDGHVLVYFLWKWRRKFPSRSR